MRHFDGITLEIGKQNILFYDPKKRYVKASKNIEGGIDVLQSESESKWESFLSKFNGKDKWSTTMLLRLSKNSYKELNTESGHSE